MIRDLLNGEGKIIVSVVIPAYNAGQYIGDALRHALAQTVKAIEIIVVDDGSTDNTIAVIQEFRDPRVRLLRQENSGPSVARNRGIAAASGQYLAFLDADDWWTPTKIEDQITALTQHPEARWSYSTAVRIDDQGRILGTLYATMSGFVLSEVVWRNCISGSASSVMAEASLLREVGGFNEALGYAEDWELWTRMAAVAPVAASDNPGVYLRERTDSYGQNVHLMKQDSLRFIDTAFSSYAAEVKFMRRKAIGWVYFNAGLGHRENGSRAKATLAFAQAIWYCPFWTNLYLALAITLLPSTRRSSLSVVSREL